jgi:hypothetical protein
MKRVLLPIMFAAGLVFAASSLAGPRTTKGRASTDRVAHATVRDTGTRQPQGPAGSTRQPTFSRSWIGPTGSLPNLNANANAVAIEHIQIENHGWAVR